MTGTIASSTLTNLDPDEIMSEYAGSLPEDTISLASISRYLNSIDDYEGDARSERLLVTRPEFDTCNLFLDPYLQFIQLNPTSLNEASKASRAFHERFHENHLQANERSIRQYGKQRALKNFGVRESVSIAVPALDRASTDDKWIFGRVKQVHNGPSYDIQTIYGVLDRNSLTSKLMPLPSTIDLEILWRLELAFEILNDFFAYEHGGERRVSSCAVFEKDRGCDWKRVGILEERRSRLAGKNS